MTMKNGERQVAPTVAGIRRDHVARYEWAARQIARMAPDAEQVLDLACGVGYGTNILAQAGFQVTGKDRNQAAIAYAQQHYAHDNATFVCEDVQSVYGFERCHAAVCFETVEHIADPLPMLKAMAAAAPLLLASVPNEDVMPFGSGYSFHHRHYTAPQFADLLASAGWKVVEWWGQEGPESEVERNLTMGRTLIAVCTRIVDAKAPPVDRAIEEFRATVDALAALPVMGVPEHVVILGLGPSLECYVDVVKRLGSRRKFADEVWAINALGDVLQCDRIFHMDDVRIQEVRAAAKPDSNIAAMLEWLKTHPGPIYTSRAHPDYPGLVEFPLQDVINSCGIAYFNSTAAYAVALAVHIGVKKITMFGCDYTMPNSHHAEKGRGCVEFHLGIAKARGIVIGIPDNTSLLDSIAPIHERIYGYDMVELDMSEDESGAVKVTFTPKAIPPTAEEIERRYNHARPTVPAALLAKS